MPAPQKFVRTSFFVKQALPMRLLECTQNRAVGFQSLRRTPIQRRNGSGSNLGFRRNCSSFSRWPLPRAAVRSRPCSGSFFTQFECSATVLSLKYLVFSFYVSFLRLKVWSAERRCGVKSTFLKQDWANCSADRQCFPEMRSASYGAYAAQPVIRQKRSRWMRIQTPSTILIILKPSIDFSEEL